MEKPRDASGQSVMRVQLPLCLQTLTDDIGVFGYCFIAILINVCYLRTYFIEYKLYYLRTLVYLRIHVIVMDLQFLYFHEALKKTEQGRSTE